MGKTVILSVAKNLVGPQELTRYHGDSSLREILRYAQNDGFLDFAVVLGYTVRGLN